MRTFIFTNYNYLLSTAGRSTFAGPSPEKHKTLKNISAAENFRAKAICLGTIFWLLAITGLVTAGNVFAQNLSATLPNTKQALTPNRIMPVNKGKITGVIVDEATGQPIAFASLTLEDQTTGKIISHFISDRDGRFLVDYLADGKYRLFVDYLSFGTTVLEGIAVAKDEVAIGPISLMDNTEAFNEEPVAGEMQEPEANINKLVYYTGSNTQAKNELIATLLQQVPGLTLNAAGDLTLWGNSNLQVLLNHKLLNLTNISFADFLNQIPSGELESIEVISSLAARADAAKTAGIIHLVTKPNNSSQNIQLSSHFLY